MTKLRKIFVIYVPAIILFIILLEVFLLFNLEDLNLIKMIFEKNKVGDTALPMAEETVSPSENTKNNQPAKDPEDTAGVSVIVRLNPLKKWDEINNPNANLLWIFDVTSKWRKQITANSAPIYLDSFSVSISPDEPVLNKADIEFSLYYDSNNNKFLDKTDAKIKDWRFQKIQNNELYFTDIPELYFDQRLTQSTASWNLYDFSRLFVLSNKKDLKITNAKFNFKNTLTRQLLEEYDKKTATNKDDLLITKFVDGETFKYFDQISADRDAFLQVYPYFKIEGGKIILTEGEYIIKETVVVPKKTTLEIKAGTTLKFFPNVSLISYGNIKAIGETDKPIIITAENKDNPWGILGIVNQEQNEAKTEFKYVEFSYGGQDYINGIFFSGMLALHYADGVIDHCKFEYATGDDALNIKYGQAVISNSYFYHNGFDAIDFDFTERGKILNNHFLENGNDAVDLGGVSNTFIYGNRMEKSGDKGISVGEQSEKPIIINNLILNNNIGIAVKDLSTSEIINNTIIGNKVGVSVYEKKNIFGGGKPEIYNTILWDNATSIEVDKDKDSEVIIINSDLDKDWKEYKKFDNWQIKPLFKKDNSFILSANNDVKLTEKGEKKYLKNYVLPEPLPSKLPIGIFTPLP